MIIGMGTDIIDKKRIEKSYQQHGDKLVKKLLSEKEMAIFINKCDKVGYLAKRWAAKEALGKAMGTGIRAPVLLPNITVLNNGLGKPYFELSETIHSILKQQQINQIHLSISDEKDLAMAWVICEHLTK